MNEALWLQLVIETMKIEHMDIVNEKYNNKDPIPRLTCKKWSKTTNGRNTTSDDTNFTKRLIDLGTADRIQTPRLMN